MGWMQRLRNSGSRRAHIERELTDEVAFHRDQQVADLVAEGWSPTDARREAQRRVGLTGAWVAEGVAQDTLPWLTTWIREMRQAARGLRRRPVLPVTSAITLALGAGVLLAIATVVDSALLAPLPLPDPSRLVVLDETQDGQPLGGNPARTADYHRELDSLRGVAGLYGESVVLGRGAEARQAQVLRGVGPFTAVLGLTAGQGRVFTEQEERDGAAVVMASDRGWTRLFGRQPAVVGQSITLRGATYQVVGILPAALDYPRDIDFIAPSGPEYQRAPRGGNWLQVVGRLAPASTLARAENEARAAARRFAETYPQQDRGLDVRLVPLQAFETRDVRAPLLLLLGAALVVYLVVCVNVGGLLLVRAMARDHESSVRTALGAGPWAMARLSVHEAVLIAAASLPGAWFVATMGLRWLGGAMSEEVAAFTQVALGGRTAITSVLVLMMTVLVLAAWPAWHVATRSARPGAAAHAVTDAPSRRRVRRALVGAQVACSTLLLVVALLFAASVQAMLDRPRGFVADDVVAVRYDLDWEQPKAVIDRLVDQVLTTVLSVPGVEAAGVVDRFPLQGGTQSARVQLYGEAEVAPGRPDISVRAATPDYFAAVGIPLTAGRLYVDGRAAEGRPEVMVSAAFARRYFGEADPLGQRLWVRWNGDVPEWSQVVGVVGDVRQTFRDEAPVPEVYRPWVRGYWPLLHVAVRTDGTASVLPRVRAALQQALPDQPLATLAPLGDVVDAGNREAHALTRVMSACALAAALLAVIGLYGLLASEMLARRREVGIRLALGARTWQLRGWLLRPGLWLTAIGVVIGLAASVPVARLLQAQLFGIQSGNLRVRVLAAAALLLAGLVAALIPAYRVVGTRALSALRYE
jgi:predicted permease